jgi:hypothetical protein
MKNALQPVGRSNELRTYFGRKPSKWLKASWVWVGIFGVSVAGGIGQEIGPPLAGCNVKGNISTTGERIYHVPGQRYYSTARISLITGERWFCSENAAIEAGWRKSRV